MVYIFSQQKKEDADRALSVDVNFSILKSRSHQNNMIEI